MHAKQGGIPTWIGEGTPCTFCRLLILSYRVVFTSLNTGSSIIQMSGLVLFMCLGRERWIGRGWLEGWIGRGWILDRGLDMERMDRGLNREGKYYSNGRRGGEGNIDLLRTRSCVVCSG